MKFLNVYFLQCYILSLLLSLPLKAYLDVSKRDDLLKTLILDTFTEVAKSKTGWIEGGKDVYYFLQAATSEFITALIKDRPEQKEFFLLDLGAGLFQWGDGMATAINKRKDLPADITVHILSVVGEDFGKDYSKESPERNGKCIVYKIGKFPIENLIEAFKEILPVLKLDPKSVMFDLIVSQWTFLHLIDPLGTLVQAYNLLRPTTGLMLMHGFPVFFESAHLEQKPESSRALKESVVDALALGNGPFLVYNNPNSSEPYVQFFMRRQDEQTLNLPLSYGSIAQEHIPGTTT
ncbi:MAG TPA: hypothetical protein VEL47_00110, partial [Myxococcota bacterium]|nr:hypothetical protein [Myxococcota bacterium]